MSNKINNVQHNSESFRQDEFKCEPAQRIKIREHRQVMQNSLVSSFLNYAVNQFTITIVYSCEMKSWNFYYKQKI